MSEHTEQAALFAWAATFAPRAPGLDLLFAIPNGARVRPGVARRLSQEGMRAGIPDVFCPMPRPRSDGGGQWHGCWIELKIKGGTVRPAQKLWIAALRAQGYRVEVAVGWVAAAAILADYLGLDAATVPAERAA